MDVKDIIAGLLFCLDWVADDLHGEALDKHQQHVQYLFNEHWPKLLQHKNLPHCGDCTDVCHTCTRCYLEKFLKDATELILTGKSNFESLE